MEATVENIEKLDVTYRHGKVIGLTVISFSKKTTLQTQNNTTKRNHTSKQHYKSPLTT